MIIFFAGKQWLYKAVAITYLKGYTSSYIDDFVYFPSDTIKTGEHQKWLLSKNYNKKPLPQFVKKINDDLETIAFLIIKNDSIQHEEYWDGYSSNSMTNSFSMAKSWVSTLVGIAIKEEKIKSVNQRVCDFLPEFCVKENEKITIKHLLTMSAGLNWSENYRNPLGHAAEAYYGHNLKHLVCKLRAIEEPGKNFNYHSASTQLLTFVLEAATGKTISNYASEKLWVPMGAKNAALWSLDVRGGDEKGFCCINSNARDFARLGKLYLNHGKWNGVEILDSLYISKATAAAKTLNKEGKNNVNYGYQFWITKYKNLNIYYAKGLWGQYVICIPQKNMLIVRLGKKYGPVLSDGHHEDLYLFIDAALEMFP